MQQISVLVYVNGTIFCKHIIRASTGKLITKNNKNVNTTLQDTTFKSTLKYLDLT